MSNTGKTFRAMPGLWTVSYMCRLLMLLPDIIHLLSVLLPEYKLLKSRDFIYFVLYSIPHAQSDDWNVVDSQ